MEQRIEPKTVLMAAENIRRLGVSKDGLHVYQQISLEISYDGYTLVLRDPSVTLTLFFHNKVKADYKRLSDLENFYTRLKNLARSA